jgi:hypothetical protein
MRPSVQLLRIGVRVVKFAKYTTMEQNKKPVDKFFYSDSEWNRLGCGPLPEERKRDCFLEAHAKGNPRIDGKAVKGYN